MHPVQQCIDFIVLIIVVSSMVQQCNDTIV